LVRPFLQVMRIVDSLGPGLVVLWWRCGVTSFANPAVTIGRTLTSTNARIAATSAPAFIAAQLIGGAIGTILAVTLYPARHGQVHAR
jgi:glycerol uptake facilitator-like aquaporin